MVYYPPYHSKYNPIERLWARLQISWSGLIIDSINKVTWKVIKCVSTFIEKEYSKGITIDKDKMKKLEEKHVYREEGIEKWLLVITP